jgi:hypothetical protein
MMLSHLQLKYGCQSVDADVYEHCMMVTLSAQMLTRQPSSFNVQAGVCISFKFILLSTIRDKACP